MLQNNLPKREGFSSQDEADLIAGQGQTIWHLPVPELFEGEQIRAHLDMAEIFIITARTGITPHSNFRVSDMALGRQGCPLFVAWDSLCATHPSKNRAVQDIGGIVNVTMLPAGIVREKAVSLIPDPAMSSLMGLSTPLSPTKPTL